MQGNADRNASLVIGQRLIARYQKPSQEKPPTPLATERVVKATGVEVCQDATREQEPSILQARHADSNEHGTALKMCYLGWQSTHQVFLANYGSSMSSNYVAHTQSADYAGVSEAAGL